MKRRRRGPRGSAFFNLTDANLIHLQAQPTNSNSATRDFGREGDGGAAAGRPQSVPGRGIPRASDVEEYIDVALSTETESDAYPSDDTDFSSTSERPDEGFATRREFLCFGYLYGRVRVTLRQYDMMREAENSFNPLEEWPSRWRLRQLRKHMLKSAIPLRRETTTRQLPVGKGKALRKLSDAVVSYIPFSEHVKRDFGDPKTAALFHSKGDSYMGTAERPAEFFQTVVARDPARYNLKNVLFRDRYRYDIGCIAQVSLDAVTTFKATLVSTAIACDGGVTTSASTYVPQSTLRLGDSLAQFCAFPDFVPPERWASCFTDERRLTLRLTRSGGVLVLAVKGSNSMEQDSWSALQSLRPLELFQESEPPECAMPQKDPYTLYVSLYGDEFNVYKRRRGSLEGYYGAYTSLSIKDRAFSVRPLFYLPPGANPDALLKRVVEDVLRASKEGVHVYDAFKQQNAVVHVYMCLGLFDFPMAAKFSNSVGAPGIEHCTSCDIVQLKTTTARKERATSSTTSFDVKDSRYSRMQERTKLVISAVKSSPQLSEDGVKDALLLNGISEKAGSLIMRLEEARGPGSFDIHEHVIVAPSHLLYYNIGSNLLMEAYDALSVQQRDSFTKQMRRCSKHVPTHTVLSSFEPEKMGGTTLSMSDYAVLLTVGPTVLQYLVNPTATSPHAVAALNALKALRRFSTALFYLPTVLSDGEEAVRTRPTVAALQVLGESLMIDLRRLLPFNGSWERPSVHRVLELLYRTLPLVQLGPAICELIFERFHQLAKREVSQSNCWNPAEYAIQRWRDTEQYSRVLSMPDAYGIPAAWLIGRKGKMLKAVSFYSLGPRTENAETANGAWRAMHTIRTPMGSKEDVWKRHAPNEAIKLWRKATRKEGSMVIKEGSTVSILDSQTEEPGSVTNERSHKSFGRVHSIATVNGVLQVAYEPWILPNMAFSVLGDPAVVTVDVEAAVSIVAADRIGQLAFVLPCGQRSLLFTKRSGFHFKSG